MSKTIIKGYYIPYSATAIHTLRQAEQTLGIEWSVDINEGVEIKVNASKIKDLERMLSPIV